MKWFIFIGLFFILKVLGFFRRYVPSEIQKRWSKLQSTFPAVQSKEIIVWKQFYKRQLGWKFRTFGQFFCQFFETSFHHYRRNSLRNIFFLRKPLLCIKFFELEGRKFFFGAKPNKLLKRVPKNNPRKTFFSTRREEKLAFEWHFSVLSAEPFVGVCQNTAFHTTKWTTCRKTFRRNFLLCIFVFMLGGQNIVH